MIGNRHRDIVKVKRHHEPINFEDLFIYLIINLIRRKDQGCF